jgi:hypothetical protein
MNKNFQRLIVVLSTASLALIMTGCETINVLDGDFESYTVLMEEDSGVLAITSGAQGWEASGKNPGYVGFAPNRFGIIVLALKEDNTSCATGAGWVITKIELSKNGNPTTQKGNNFGGNQKGWLTKAFPAANDSGVLLDVGKNAATTSFVVGNKNNHKSSEGRKMAYYQVTASQCAGSLEVTTDPGWQNGGKGNN